MPRINKENLPLLLFSVAFCAMPLLSVLSPNVYGSFPLILGVLAGAFCFTLPAARRPALDGPLAVFLAVLLTLALCSALWSEWPAVVFSKWLKAAATIVAGYLLYGCLSLLPPADADRLRRWFPRAFAAAALLLASELAFKHPLYRLIKQIPGDQYIVPSLVNQAAVILSLLYWPLLLIMTRRAKRLPAILGGVALFAVLVTFGRSETALLALAAGAAAFGISRAAPRLAWTAACAGGILLILLAPWLVQFAFTHFGDSLSAWKGASAGQRLEIWNGVARKISQHPFHGHGMEASRNIADFGFANLYYQRGGIMHPHNNVLQLWIEFGALGAAWLAGFFAFLLWRARRLAGPERAAAMACLASAAAVALVGYGLWQGWWLGILFILAMTLQLARGERQAS